MEQPAQNRPEGNNDTTTGAAGLPAGGMLFSLSSYRHSTGNIRANAYQWLVNQAEVSGNHRCEHIDIDTQLFLELCLLLFDQMVADFFRECHKS